MAIDTERLNTIVQAFVTQTSHVQGAALVTHEGLPIASTLPQGLEESRAAAMAAAVMTIGDRIGEDLQRGTMQHIMLLGCARLQHSHHLRLRSPLFSACQQRGQARHFDD